MVVIPSKQAEAFVAKPDRAIRAFLLHGPDQGLVSERAQKLAAAIAARDTPAGEIIRLDDADLEGDPDRLSVELLTIPMFGGAKIVRISTSRRVNTAMLQPLVGGGQLAGALIVEAGVLRRDDKLKALFEKSAGAAALACYADESTTLDALVGEVLKASDMAITPDARQELLARLGADRALSRAEIEKLALYAYGTPQIEVDDVIAVVGDASELTLDLAANAAAIGDAGRALAECDRAVSSGESAQSVVLATERHFHRLHKLRSSVDAGRSLDEAIRTLRPMPPQKVQGEIGRQLRIWTSERLSLAIGRIVETVRRSRTTGSNETVLAERLLIEIARLARAGQAQAGQRRG